jgi:septum formation protein
MLGHAAAMPDGTDLVTTHPRLVLASASERRRKILLSLGLDFDVTVPEVDEIHIDADARASVTENAQRKNRWCAERYPLSCVLSADTVIEFGGRCVGKPVDLGAAMDMLSSFSGKSHCVLTGVALSCPSQRMKCHVAASTVRFRTLAATDIESYVRLVDPLDKAGAYDIDQHGEILIEAYSGSRTNIMGLPAEVVAEWLEGCGFTVRGTSP